MRIIMISPILLTVVCLSFALLTKGSIDETNGNKNRVVPNPSKDSVEPGSGGDMTESTSRNNLQPSSFCPNRGVEFSMNMCGHNATDSTGIHYETYNSSYLQSLHMDNCYCNVSSITNIDKELNYCILEAPEIQINIPIQHDGQYELVMKFVDICCSHISHRMFRGYLNELTAFDPMYLPEVNVVVERRLDFLVGNNVTDLIVGRYHNKIVDKRLNLGIQKNTYFHEPAIISSLYVRNKLCGGDKNICHEMNERCEEFAGLGECAKNPSFMLTHCKKACGLCSTKYTNDDITQNFTAIRPVVQSDEPQPPAIPPSTTT